MKPCIELTPLSNIDSQILHFVRMSNTSITSEELSNTESDRVNMTQAVVLYRIRDDASLEPDPNTRPTSINMTTSVHDDITHENPEPILPLRIPTPPPLPPPSALPRRRQTSSSGKTPLTNGSTSDSEGRHICSNGISYPPLDELLKFGRVNRTQLIEVEKRFDSNNFHCLSHLICEGIYHISNVKTNDHLMIEDFPPLSRNDFEQGLRDPIETYLRSRTINVTPNESSNPGRTRTIKVNPLSTSKSSTTSRPPASDASTKSPDLTIDTSVQFPPPRYQTSEIRSSDELTSPVRQNILRSQMQGDSSDHETVKPHTGSSSKSFKPSPDLNKNMASALEHCSLPQIFTNLRLTFLHYIHQSLYSLHLRSHVKTQSYPKPDILELLIIGRDLCDQRSRYNADIRNPQLLKLFLRELFSRKSRKIRSNCFSVPMLKEGQTITSSLALEAFTSFHQLYQVEWNQQFGQMITPSFV